MLDCIVSSSLGGDDSQSIFQGLVDEYFELKAEELENWERQLKRLHGALTSLVTTDQDLSNAKFLVSRSIAQLANVEEHTGLAQALSRLAETEEEVSHKHAIQSEAELVRLVECARETLGLIQGCKDVLDERVKAFRNWKAAEAALRSKREQKVRFELAGKGDQRKMAMLDAEIEELSNRVDQEEASFKKISRTIKEEFDRFDVTRFADFKRASTEFLEVMLHTQVKVICLNIQGSSQNLIDVLSFISPLHSCGCSIS
ncbi:unnamed protein product [Echinostoma caproni]|uniref:Vps5 domain-containing protein n=1 Tax=Echinostoma caproni TaxID=27848 RepID=A0A183AYU2_9TREM|nr:unnamed protein product [Echinostoma caproni]